ncbi:hypothetical protein NMBES14902_1740, partial [Neisseria meningitidis ES14902]
MTPIISSPINVSIISPLFYFKQKTDRAGKTAHRRGISLAFYFFILKQVNRSFPPIYACRHSCIRPSFHGGNRYGTTGKPVSGRRGGIHPGAPIQTKPPLSLRSAGRAVHAG